MLKKPQPTCETSEVRYELIRAHPIILLQSGPLVLGVNQCVL